MSIEVKVPPLPESVADAIVASWHKKPGDPVKRDENLVDLETDKVVLEVPAPADGVLEAIHAQAGATVNSGQVLALIAAGAAAPASAPPSQPSAAQAAASAAVTAPATAPATPAEVAPSAVPAPGPAATRVLAEAGVSAAEVAGSGRRGQVTKADAVAHVKAQSAGAAHRQQERVPMTRLRQRIAERMMQSKNSIAMLTSFNEINMKGVMDLRKQYAEAFEKTHGIKLGFMGFFVKAAAESLKRHPVVNASTEGNDILYHGYADISIAVATERGLVTPVIRNAELKSIAEIEAEIADYAKRAREGGLQLEELQGGTFTITNGGVFGSLFSTPIVNPPQSAILGMHAIKDRPIVEAGQIVIAPMMYVALSYDHRIVDGKDAVTFLVDVKNAIENPARMLLGV